MTKEQLHEALAKILHELFDVPREKIVPHARLYEELDIDSIDAVDLIVRMKPLVAGKSLDPTVFRHVRTVQDVVDAVHPLLANSGAAGSEPGVAG